MKGKFSLVVIALLFLFFCANGAFAQTTITFDDLITGATSYQFDSDGDSVYDVIFSTPDPAGFNTMGPGPWMTYIDEPGLEGSTLVSPYDLRVDFYRQAQDYLNFGFALDDFQETPNTWTEFWVYNSSDTLIAHDFEYGLYTYPYGPSNPPSDFPEGMIETTFSGVAAYALFDFNNDPTGGQRYIIDNFEGNYGSTEQPPVPIPGAVWLLGSGLIGLAGLRKKFNS